MHFLWQREGREVSDDWGGKGVTKRKTLTISHSVLNFGFFEEDVRISDYPIAVVINCEQGAGNWKAPTLTDAHVSNSIVSHLIAHGVLWVSE
jgi:hypothetical protein